MNRQESDNLCKYLAETYPSDFASWILGQQDTSAEVLKTELSLEPIRADSVTFLRTRRNILHLEFQVRVPAEDPMPLRMLDYWVRLYRQHRLPVIQVVIWLKETSNPAVFENQFSLGFTRHQYQVIRMWEQSPEALLTSPGLLPLATLAATTDANALLSRIAGVVDKIEEQSQMQVVLDCIPILAGLRFDTTSIYTWFRKSIMKESVVYQDFVQDGRQEELLKIVLRLLTRRLGTIGTELEANLRVLSLTKLEELAEALLDFSNPADLVAWLQQD